MVNQTPSATWSVVLCVLRAPCTSMPAPFSIEMAPWALALSIFCRFFQSFLLFQPHFPQTHAQAAAFQEALIK